VECVKQVVFDWDISIACHGKATRSSLDHASEDIPAHSRGSRRPGLSDAASHLGSGRRSPTSPYDTSIRASSIASRVRY
jgi:hypothetical protein